MGTINYRTSEYITLAVKPKYPSDFYADKGTMGEAEYFAKEWECSVDDALWSLIETQYEDITGEIGYKIDMANSFYFKLKLELGYYEGFSVQISNELPGDMTYDEKEAAYKEADNLEQFLIECADLGLVECYPGWCMGYEDKDTTVADIRKAMEQVRKDIEDTPVWYNKEFGSNIW